MPGLVRQFGLHAEERAGDHPQHVVGIELRADDLLGDQVARRERAQQVADQCGLAGTHVAGDDDEALGLMHAVVEVGHRTPVAATAKEEGRVRD